MTEESQQHQQDQITEAEAPTTGFILIDMLQPKDRIAYIERARWRWQNLTKEERLQEVDNTYAIARTIIRESNGVINTFRKAIKFYNNVILPQYIEEQIKALEENADAWDLEAKNWNMPNLHEIANFLRDRREAFKMWGVDALLFDVNLTDNPNEIGVNLTIQDIRNNKKEIINEKEIVT